MAAVLVVAACTVDNGVHTTGARDATAATSVAAPGDDQDVPTDPDVRQFTLDAGSAHEEADQVGVAHFLEHTLFNGTARFPSNDLVGVLAAPRATGRTATSRSSPRPRDAVGLVSAG